MALSNFFSEKEKRILEDYLGSEYIVLGFISGKCYALDENGSFTYNDCFTFTDNKYFSQQMYSEVSPYRMIRFYGFYLMQTLEEESWFRGRKDTNGNYEFDCMADSLEEILESL